MSLINDPGFLFNKLHISVALILMSLTLKIGNSLYFLTINERSIFFISPTKVHIYIKYDY